MSKKRTHLTRRKLLKHGIAAAASGAAGLLSAPGVQASSQGPSVVTRRRFRAWISRGNGPGRTTLHDVTLRPISGRQVVVRTESTNLCYSNAGAVLGLPPMTVAGSAAPASALAPPPGVRRMNDLAVIQGHG